MSNKIENIITVSNIMELVEATITKIGFEYQAPLAPEQLTECVAGAVNKFVNTLGETK